MFDDVSAAASQADLLVSHPVTFATPIVAERRGLPWASAVSGAHIDVFHL